MKLCHGLAWRIYPRRETGCSDAIPRDRNQIMWLNTLRHRASLHLRQILKSASTTPPHPHISTRSIISIVRISPTRHTNMSSSDAYEAFLKKSQKDYSAGADDVSPAHVTNTPQIERNPHPAINALGSECFYTSDVDEAFEPISLSWSKESLPTGGMHRIYSPSQRNYQR